MGYSLNIYHRGVLTRDQLENIGKLHFALRGRVRGTGWSVSSWTGHKDNGRVYLHCILYKRPLTLDGVRFDWEEELNLLYLLEETIETKLKELGI